MRRIYLTTALTLWVLTAALLAVHISVQATSTGGRHDSAVHALFDLTSPEGGPFPSDRFTVADLEQNTGRRMNLPMPADCVANRSDCDDIALLNLLDGFNQHPRLSIPFDGDIDPSTATSDNIFLVQLPESASEQAAGASCDGDEAEGKSGASIGRIVGINQIIWDPSTHTLHARSDVALEEHSRYVLVVTRRVLDTNANPIAPSDEFERYRNDLHRLSDTEARWYRRELITAEWAARRAGVQNRDIAALSVFHTQSSTYMARRIHDQIFAAPTPAPADFNIGPGGNRADYPLSSITSVTFNRQLTTGPALTPQVMDLFPVRFVPGAIDRVALGRYESPDYMVHPGEYIPEIATRTGAPVQQGTNTIYFNLYLPSGPMPANGWPVAITGHGNNQHKNFAVDSSTSIPASHGLALIAINAVGHGQGPLSTLTFARTDGTNVTHPAGGRGRDQNGDGLIGTNEGGPSTGSRRIKDRSDAAIQTAADLMQLVRVIQAGVDVDGDGQKDLDATRINYYGHSFGGNYGMVFFAATPEVQAGVFSAIGSPILVTNSRNPVARPTIGTLLGARTPSLLNSAFGLTTIDGVSVSPGPTFNENQPLRNLPPVVNTVPGAIAIQQFLERSSWLGRTGDAAAFAPLLRRSLPPGLAPRPVLIQIARGDQSAQNPTAGETIRAGALEDRTSLYRHDLFYPTVPPSGTQKNPHGFCIILRAALSPWQPIVVGAQEQIAQFLASDGSITIVPTPAEYWEVPIAGPLPEDLGYIP